MDVWYHSIIPEQPCGVRVRLEDIAIIKIFCERERIDFFVIISNIKTLIDETYEGNDVPSSCFNYTNYNRYADVSNFLLAFTRLQVKA